MWIGHPGVQPRTDQERFEIEKLLQPYNCVPVYVKEEVFYQANLFHELHIRPLFHNFKSYTEQDYGNKKRETLFLAYQEVN